MCNLFSQLPAFSNTILIKRFILSLLTLLLNQLKRQDVIFPSTVPDKLCINLADKWLLISSKKGMITTLAGNSLGFGAKILDET